jgi:hypothetical protein
VKFSKTVGSKAFRLEQLNSDAPLGGFACPVEEYNVYLYEAFTNEEEATEFATRLSKKMLHETR